MKKLNMDSWREMFYEKIEEVKPQDHWDLKMDQNLDYNDLVPGWKQSLQEHSFARQSEMLLRGLAWYNCAILPQHALLV
ncbi:receptor-transporting protein 1-like isoform X2 [Gopherus flavomarginatus]|uniref:receptor-transporting protein 1-like isoform X2 n=1 Tax=Gopherus flavomarginatus TaxID=286002 RepID=UPI0021CC13F6|nr:receptor-transporting protein 1-like isoform X2 [Gopherus flavomarginatus]